MKRNDTDILHMVREMTEEARDRCSLQHQLADENEGFIGASGLFEGSTQWEGGSRSRFGKGSKSGHRARLELHGASLVIDAISGREMTSRFQPRVDWRNREDAGVAKAGNSALAWMRSEEAAQVESDAFRRMCIGAMVGVHWKTSFAGGVASHYPEEVSIWETHWDPGAKKRNLEDRRWGQRIIGMSLRRFLQEYAHLGVKEEDFLDMRSAGGGEDENTASASISYYEPWEYDFRTRGSVPYSRAEDLAFIKYTEWIDSETMVKVQVPTLDPSMEQQFLQGDSMPLGRQLAERMRMGAIGSRPMEVSVEQWRKEQKIYKEITGESYDDFYEFPVDMYYSSLTAGDTYVLQSRKIPEQAFSLMFMTAIPEHRMHAGTGWYGPVERMRDAQRLESKLMSLTLEFIASMPKAMGYDTNKIDGMDVEEMRSQLADPRGMIPVSGPPSEAVQPFASRSVPPEVMSVLSHVGSLVSRYGGIDPYSSLGSGTTNLARTSTSTVTSVQAASTAVLGHMYAALREYRKEAAMWGLKALWKYHDTEELQGVVGEELAPSVPPPDYDWDRQMDMVVDEEPETPTVSRQRLRDLGQSQFFATLVPLILQADPGVLAKLIPDLPGDVSARLEEAFKTSQQGPPPGPPGQ